MKLNIPMQFRGTYDFTLKRKDGTIQKATVHNIATSNIVNTSASSTLSIGSGSGTPAITDTKLFTHLWNIAASSISQVQNVGDDGARITITYIVPATTQYAATITEVGMGERDKIWTHAMLVDAESNPISIVKTENDELTVVVTLELYIVTALTITTAFEPWVAVSIKPTLAALLLAGFVSNTRYTRILRGETLNVGTRSLAISVQPRNVLLPYRYRHSSNDDDNGVTPQYLAWSPDKTLMKHSITGNLRCRNDSFNTHYYRYLQLSMCYSGGSGYLYAYDIAAALDLKDPNIFPPQLLSNITLATGDGVTTDFACPLNYFQKDTEVLYKNGVALTRGVDYTIENDANKDRLPELMHIIYSNESPTKITSDASLWPKSSYLQFQAENAIQKSSYITYDEEQVCTAFNDVYPLHFDWGAPRRCNCLQGYLYRRYTGTLYVEYSADNVTWEKATELSIKSSGYITAEIDLTWPVVEARYWRIRITRYGTSSSEETIAYFTTGGKAAYFGYSNPLGVHFTTPPTENDVITMDCYVDIPLKNANFAFNLALDLSVMYS